MQIDTDSFYMMLSDSTLEPSVNLSFGAKLENGGK